MSKCEVVWILMGAVLVAAAGLGAFVVVPMCSAYCRQQLGRLIVGPASHAVAGFYLSCGIIGRKRKMRTRGNGVMNIPQARCKTNTRRLLCLGKASSEDYHLAFSRSASAIAMVLCFALFGVPASAAADSCPRPSSEIATDRPDVTNSSGLLWAHGRALGPGRSGLLPECVYGSGFGYRAPQGQRGLHNRVRAGSAYLKPRCGLFVPERQRCGHHWKKPAPIRTQ